MRRSLKSILRLRSLLEEESRMRLEKLVKQASRVEDARLREEQIASACRDAAALAISEEGAPGADDGWKTAFVECEIAEVRGKELESLEQRIAGQVQAHFTQFITHRKERLQVETLLRNEARLRARELERREQRNVDDWFGASRSTRRLTD